MNTRVRFKSEFPLSEETRTLNLLHLNKSWKRKVILIFVFTGWVLISYFAKIFDDKKAIR